METNQFPSLPNEIWLPIKACDGRYFASSMGRIRSLRKVLKPDSRGGYLYVCVVISGATKTALVSRLVAATFLPEPDQMANEVNHKDLDKSNNAASNLEWVTRKENIQHARAAKEWSRPKSPATLAAVAAACANPHLTLEQIAMAHRIHRVTLCRALAGDRCPHCSQKMPRLPGKHPQSA